MEEKEKELDTELSENNTAEGAAEDSGVKVKYENNDNWNFDAEAPSLRDDLFEPNSVIPEKEDKEPVSVKQETAPVAAKKAVNRDKVQFIITGVLVVLIAAALIFLGVRYNTVPNGKEGKNMNPASVVATVDGTKISVGLFNYYYSTIVSNYEQYADSYGLDPTKDYDTQYTVDENGDKISWLDFFEKKTLDQIKAITTYYNAGVEAGLTLTDKHKETIEQYIDSYKTSASAEAKSLNDYLEELYGPYCTEDTLRVFFEHYLIGACYRGYYSAQQTVTDEEIDSYFAEHKNDFYQINLCYVAISYDTENKAESQAVVDDYMAKITDRDSITKLIPELYSDYISEDIAAAMEADSSLTEEEARKQAIETYTQSIDGVINGSQPPFDDEINEWLFSDDTPIGAKNYYVDESIGYAYILLKTEAPTLVEYPTYAVRHILIQPKADDDEKQQALEFTDEQWKAAEESANAVLDEFVSGDKTELSFALLAEAKTEDTASTSSALSGYYGGLYEGVSEGAMQPEFEKWAMDSSHKYGDTGIVKTEYGYHIMYFVYQQPSYKANIIYLLKDEKTLASVEDMELKERKSVLDRTVNNFYENRKSAADLNNQ